MATATYWYVNTDATGAGNGTSYTDGYTSLQACISAKAKDLVSADEQMNIYCKGSAADTTAVVVSGFTTDATRYLSIFVEVENRSTNGVYTTSKYRLEVGTSHCMDIQNNFVRVTGLQLYQTKGVGFANYHGINAVGYYGISISKCNIKQTTATSENVASGIVSTGATTTNKNKIYNNVVYDFIYGTGIAAGGDDGSPLVYANTCFNNGYNIRTTGYGQCLAKNNLAVSGDMRGQFAAGSTKNCYETWTDYDSIPAGNTLLTEFEADLFADYTAKNFNVKDSSAQNYAAGADLSAEANLAIIDDIIGTSRKANPDVGAFELIESSSDVNLIDGLLGKLLKGRVS